MPSAPAHGNRIISSTSAPSFRSLVWISTFGGGELGETSTGICEVPGFRRLASGGSATENRNLRLEPTPRNINLPPDRGRGKDRIIITAEWRGAYAPCAAPQVFFEPCFNHENVCTVREEGSSAIGRRALR